MKLINFLAAVDRLGKNNRERAALLDMTDRQLLNWKNQAPPRLLNTLVSHPDLLAALLDDARDAQKAAKETSIAS